MDQPVGPSTPLPGTPSLPPLVEPRPAPSTPTPSDPTPPSPPTPAAHEGSRWIPVEPDPRDPPTYTDLPGRAGSRAAEATRDFTVGAARKSVPWLIVPGAGLGGALLLGGLEQGGVITKEAAILTGVTAASAGLGFAGKYAEAYMQDVPYLRDPQFWPKEKERIASIPPPAPQDPVNGFWIREKERLTPEDRRALISPSTQQVRRLLRERRRAYLEAGGV